MRSSISLFLLSFFAIGCSSTVDNHRKEVSEKASETTLAKDSMPFKADTSYIETDSLSGQIGKEAEKQAALRKVYLREGEAVTDAKLNGEPILLQLEVSSRVLSRHPDTIRNILKGEYLSQESRFPRSISDNVEKGTSTERISYPRLNYRLEIFEDEFAAKPYKKLQYTIRKEKEKIIVE